MPLELFSILLTVTAVNLAAWITPGPNMLAIISASVSGGRPSGILTGLGVAAAGSIWATLAMLGVTALFELFPRFVFALKLLGAVYLLWLGFKALHAAWQYHERDMSLRQSHLQGWHAFRSGFIVMATNAKAALFFSSILTAVVPAKAPPGTHLAVVALCTALGVVCHTITATVFSTPFAVRRFRLARRKINAVFGMIFAGLGLGVAYEAYRKF